VHNGNLTNATALKQELLRSPPPHQRQATVLINVLAHGSSVLPRPPLNPEVFKAVAAVHRRLKGSYAVVALIAGHGLLAFRDPFGIRPLCFGEGSIPDQPDGRSVMVASESVALEAPATMCATSRPAMVFIDGGGRCTPQCAESRAEPVHVQLLPARPDSVMDGISVYQARLNMGETLAQRVSRRCRRRRSTWSSRFPNRAARARCSWRRRSASLTAKVS
jgi:amidophosphoribosyltransferase